MIGLAARLQAYLREKAHMVGRERLPVPPFTLYLNPTVNDPLEGIAIPDEAAAYSPADVARLVAAFSLHGRVPCVQYLDAFAPGLTITLALGVPGFEETLRLPVLYCTAAMLRHPPDVRELRVAMVSAESPLDEAKHSWDLNARGFDKDFVPATDLIAEAFRATLSERRAFNAYLDGEAVATGLFTDLRDGLTELVGITTLPAFRRRGIGAALTAAIARAAFDSGAEVVFLIAANDAAARVYDRLGFQTVARLLEYAQSPGIGADG